MTEARWMKWAFILSWLASPKGPVFTTCLQTGAKNAAFQVGHSSGKWKTHLALEQYKQMEEEDIYPSLIIWTVQKPKSAQL